MRDLRTACRSEGGRPATSSGQGQADRFVLRLKLPGGMRIMPHTHPKDERVTVLSGTPYLGMGDKFDEKAAKEMPAGSYGRMGAGMRHFGYVNPRTKKEGDRT